MALLFYKSVTYELAASVLLLLYYVELCNVWNCVKCWCGLHMLAFHRQKKNELLFARCVKLSFI